MPELPPNANANANPGNNGNPPETIPEPTIENQGTGFRAYTENGCVFGRTRQEAIQKHIDRMNNRVLKGRPMRGRGHNA